MKEPSVSRPFPPRHADLHPSSSSSSLLRRPSTSSLHLPSPPSPSSSSSSTTDHHYHHHLLLQHHGPPAPAPPPQHPPLQPPRPSSSGPSSWGYSGGGQKVQQSLVVSDRSEGFSGRSLHSVALSYGTLPRAPRRTAPPPSSSSSSFSSSTSSLPRPRGGPGPAPPLGPRGRPDLRYATLSHPRRSANTTTPSNSHYRQPLVSDKSNGTVHLAPSHYPPHHPRVPGEGPTQPLRLDMPPECDWRHTDYRTAQPTSTWGARLTRHHQPLQRADSHQRPPPQAPRGPQLCSLCQQLPAEPSRPYCLSCGAYMARFRPGS